MIADTSADAPGRLFESALAHHSRAARPYDEARTHLAYGEFLRRSQRRVDARNHLRRALETFSDLHPEPLADRATAELRASGETARSRDPSTLLELTPMELKVAQLVAAACRTRTSPPSAGSRPAPWRSTSATCSRRPASPRAASSPSSTSASTRPTLSAPRTSRPFDRGEQPVRDHARPHSATSHRKRAHHEHDTHPTDHRATTDKPSPQPRTPEQDRIGRRVSLAAGLAQCRSGRRSVLPGEGERPHRGGARWRSHSGGRCWPCCRPSASPTSRSAGPRVPAVFMAVIGLALGRSADPLP